MHGYKTNHCGRTSTSKWDGEGTGAGEATSEEPPGAGETLEQRGAQMASRLRCSGGEVDHHTRGTVSRLFPEGSPVVGERI